MVNTTDWNREPPMIDGMTNDDGRFESRPLFLLKGQINLGYYMIKYMFHPIMNRWKWDNPSIHIEPSPPREPWWKKEI